MRVTTKSATTFFLIFILALGLRISGITYDSLWLDESYQSMVGAFGEPLPDLTAVPDKPYKFQFGKPRPLNEVLSRFRQVDPLCPPLHAVLLNRWMQVFGQGDAAVRALSVLFSMAGLVALFLLVQRTFGTQAALLSALVQAVSPFDIFYAQEARMYSLLSLCATVSFGSLIVLAARFQRHKLDSAKPARLDLAWVFLLALHAAAAWALINSHYTGLFVFLAQILFGLWAAFSMRSIFFLFSCLCAWVLVALMWIPWLPLFLQSAKLRTASFYVMRDRTNLLWPLWAVVRIVINWIVFLSGKKVAWYAFGVYATSAALLVSSLFASVKFTRKIFSPALPLTAIWMWLLVPPLVLLAMDIVEGHRVIEIPRYLMATVPASFILAGLGLKFLSSAGARFAGWLLVLHVAFAILGNFSAHISYQREPWRELAEKVQQVAAPDDLVVIAQHYDLVCLNRYLRKPLLQVGVSTGMSRQHILSVIGSRARFVLITAQEGEAIMGQLPASWKVLEKYDWPHGLHLRVITQTGDAR